MEITSREGTTQGDNLAMAFYAVSIKPLIDRLKAHLCRQPWFADEAASIGKLQHVKSWWESFLSLGPRYGYYPRPDKCWLILKDETSKKVAEDLFASSKVNITTEGHRYLGRTLGSAQFKQQYIGKLIEEWVIQIDKLSEMATREPHLSYAVFVKVMQSKWSFAMRTIPGIDDGLTKLEVHIRYFLEKIMGRTITDFELRVLALPCKIGGLGVFIPTTRAEREHENSKQLCTRLTSAVIEKCELPPWHCTEERKAIRKRNEEHTKLELNLILQEATPSLRRALEVLEPTGTPPRLSCMPSREHGFYFNRDEFRDCLNLRYEWPLVNMATKCECGQNNSIDHSLSCKLGGFVIMRHNCVRDLFADVLDSVCKDVSIEPCAILPDGTAQPSGDTKKNE